VPASKGQGRLSSACRSKSSPRSGPPPRSPPRVGARHRASRSRDRHRAPGSTSRKGTPT
jgi:hypothetical protein